MKNIFIRIKNFLNKKSNLILITFFIGFLLIVSNYLWTFNGYVTYTAEERQVATLFKEIRKVRSEKSKEETVVWLKNQSNYKQELFYKYSNVYKKSKHSKTFNQFLIEETLIILGTTLLVFFIKKRT